MFIYIYIYREREREGETEREGGERYHGPAISVFFKDPRVQNIIEEKQSCMGIKIAIKLLLGTD